MSRSSTANGRKPADDINLPPQNLDAEASVLGSMMLDRGGHVSDEIMQVLTARHFYCDANALIFSAICDMKAKGQPVDAVTLAAELDKRGQYAEIGGAVRLAELMEIVPHTAHGVYYANEVRNEARRRNAMAAGIDLARRARDKSIDTEELLADAESAIHAEMEDGLGNRPIAIADLLQEAIRATKEETAKPRQIETGMDRLDTLTGGGVPSAGVTIVAARPSQGKTALAASTAVNAAEHGRKVLFCSYEQPALEVTQRFLAIASGVSFHDLSRPNTDPKICNRIMDGAGRLGRLKISIDCTCRNATGLATLIRLEARRGTDLIIVDYLQLIEADDRRAPREQQVASITRKLKTTAMAVGVPLIVLSQLNREVEKRADQKPRLSDLRESGAIEQDADMVWLLHRPGSYQGDHQDRDGKPLPPIEDNFGVLNVAKFRNGPTGEVKLVWDAPTMRYSADVTDPFGGKL